MNKSQCFYNKNSLPSEQKCCTVLIPHPGEYPAHLNKPWETNMTISAQDSDVLVPQVLDFLSRLVNLNPLRLCGYQYICMMLTVIPIHEHPVLTV